MDNILSSLERISELSEDELNSLKESVFTEYKSVKPKDETSYTVEVVDTLNQLADAKDAINAELAQRAEAASQLAAAAEAATSRLDEEEPAAEEAADSADAPAEEEAEATAEEAPADDKEEEEKKDEEEDPEAEKKAAEFATKAPASDFGPESGNEPKGAEQGAVEAPEPIETVDVATDPTAKMPYGDVSPESVEEAKASHDVPENTNDEHPQSTTSHAKLSFAADEEVTTESSEEPVSTSNLNSFSAPEENAPVVEAAKAVKTITASADFDRVTAGTQLTSLSQVAQGIVTKRHSIANGVGADNEYIRVASIETEFSADRTLGYNDAEGNKAKIDAALKPITAAGGLTAPVETSYDIFELGETDARPVRDSLPKFNAQRGGIRFLTSPIIDDLNGAVSVWTLQNDIDAASDAAPNPVKPCLRVQAGEEVTVVVDAIPLCLTFGNLQTRAYPELVERHIKLGMVWHARFAEQRLLTRIGQLSTNVTAAASLGAARDILSQVEVAAAAYRNRYRIDSDTSLRVIFPEWFRNALRSDLMKQLPGDGRDGTFNLGEAEINSWFATRKINVTWHIDGEAGQIFGAQELPTPATETVPAGTVALMEFPETLVWYLFSEGTFLFLDAGTLDLGLVRDSTLNGTNDYKIFLETFEGVAKVGQESLRISSALSIRGASSGTVDVPVTNSI
jgi:chemotaxis protein histidine kinase CheA